MELLLPQYAFTAKILKYHRKNIYTLTKRERVREKI